jgi:carboxylesterase type B
MSARDIVQIKAGGSICVDGTVVTRDTFQAIVERGKAGVPLLAGTVATEGTLYTRGKNEAQEHYDWLNRYLRHRHALRQAT